MRFLNKIFNVRSLHVLNDGFYSFSPESKLSKYIDGRLCWERTINTQHFLMEINARLVSTYWQYKRTVLIDREIGEIVLETEIPFKPLKSTGFKIIGVCTEVNLKNDREFKISTMSIDGDIEVLLETGGYGIKAITDEIFLLQNGWNNYRAISISTQIELWQVDLTSFFKHDGVFSPINSFIEHQGKLFFSLGNLHKSGVYVLDALTGKLLFQTEEIGGPFKLANDLLYDFNGEVLYIFDPITFDFVQKDFTDLLKPGNLRYFYHGVYQNMAIEGNLLYYASLYGDRDANYTQIALVVLDIEKAELVEVIPFPSDGGAIIDVQVHQNRLFALTTSDVLHVFER